MLSDNMVKRLIHTVFRHLAQRKCIQEYMWVFIFIREHKNAILYVVLLGLKKC